MMQKIKYPVGSVIKGKTSGEVVIGDTTSGGLVAFIFDKNGDVIDYMTQKQLDDSGFTIISFPPFKPEIGQEYWYMMSDGDMDEIVWENKRSDIFRLKSGNVFRSENEVRIKRDEINSREI